MIVLGWAEMVIIFVVDVKIKGYSQEVRTRTTVFSRKDLYRTYFSTWFAH